MLTLAYFLFVSINLLADIQISLTSDESSHHTIYYLWLSRSELLNEQQDDSDSF